MLSNHSHRFAYFPAMITCSHFNAMAWNFAQTRYFTMKVCCWHVYSGSFACTNPAFILIKKEPPTRWSISKLRFEYRLPMLYMWHATVQPFEGEHLQLEGRPIFFLCNKTLKRRAGCGVYRSSFFFLEQFSAQLIFVSGFPLAEHQLVSFFTELCTHHLQRTCIMRWSSRSTLEGEACPTETGRRSGVDIILPRRLLWNENCISWLRFFLFHLQRFSFG